MKRDVGSPDAYLEQVKSFHGHLAPGVVLGGFMVNLALRSLPDEGLFDAICETEVCLPDAIQLLTPCTVGNGWLTVLNFGRFALTLYEKSSGAGVRVYLDSKKVRNYSEVNAWFFKLKPKSEQDSQLLIDQILQAGEQILSLQRVRVRPESLRRKKRLAVADCPQCGEGYPVRDGSLCRACQGESPYLETETADVVGGGWCASGKMKL